jgi:hypothetical protein
VPGSRRPHSHSACSGETFWTLIRGFFLSAVVQALSKWETRTLKQELTELRARMRAEGIADRHGSYHHYIESAAAGAAERRAMPLSSNAVRRACTTRGVAAGCAGMVPCCPTVYGASARERRCERHPQRRSDAQFYAPPRASSQVHSEARFRPISDGPIGVVCAAPPAVSSTLTATAARRATSSAVESADRCSAGRRRR